MNLTPVMRIVPEHELVICRPLGRLDADLIEWLLIYTNKIEATEKEPLNRFVDLSQLSEIQLSDEELRDIAQARRYALPTEPVRSAILAPSPLACAVARMYEILMEDTTIEVRVFRELESAARWLEVPAAILSVPEAEGGIGH